MGNRQFVCCVLCIVSAWGSFVFSVIFCPELPWQVVLLFLPFESYHALSVYGHPLQTCFCKAVRATSLRHIRLVSGGYTNQASSHNRTSVFDAFFVCCVSNVFFFCYVECSFSHLFFVARIRRFLNFVLCVRVVSCALKEWELCLQGVLMDMTLTPHQSGSAAWCFHVLRCFVRPCVSLGHTSPCKNDRLG